LFFLCA